MFPATSNTNIIKNTSHKLVLPFYAYASLAFLVSAILLFTSSSNFTGHYFHPEILAITHIMALGWGSMIILGAGHQLIPVLIESSLYNEKLAYASFVLMAVGIPLLIYGFYVFDMGPVTKWGGRFVLLGILAFLINIAISLSKSKQENVHAIFVFTSTIWLFLTALMGLAQVYNFTTWLLPENSVHYLSLHAHTGIIGWFLLLIIGVASRLIPMFLISKYKNPRLLWWVYGLVNGALFAFIFLFFYSAWRIYLFLPGLAVAAALILFIYYCVAAYRQRIRKQVDEQLKLSLLSVTMMTLPLILLFAIIFLLVTKNEEKINLSLAYGFLIFFGWITAIILGMTFKTLPFIVWHKIYHQRAGIGKTPNPKDLFSNTIFRIMSFCYIPGFLIFGAGILLKEPTILKAGAALLLLTAILYNWNVIKLIMHKAVSG